MTVALADERSVKERREREVLLASLQSLGRGRGSAGGAWDCFQALSLLYAGRAGTGASAAEDKPHMAAAPFSGQPLTLAVL